MSFEKLYNGGLKQMKVTKITETSENREETCIGSIFNSYKFVLFYILKSNDRLHTELNILLPQLLSNRVMEERNSEKKNNTSSKLKQFFTIKKKKLKKQEDEKSYLLENVIILFDLDNNCNDNYANILNSINIPHDQKDLWYKLDINSPIFLGKFLRTLHYNRIPQLCLIETDSKKVMTYEAKRWLMEDPCGANYPWFDEPLSTLFKGKLYKKNSENSKIEVDFSTLSGVVKALVFGANWAPPCRAMIKQLIPIYKQLKTSKINIEFIFCSTDLSEESYDLFYNQMPWYAFPYDKVKLGNLSKTIGVTDIPAVILINENDKIITKHGRSCLLYDQFGKNFPWDEQPIYELNEGSAPRLSDGLSLVLFTEGSPEDVRFSIDVLKSISEECFPNEKDISNNGDKNSLGVTKSTSLISMDSILSIQENMQVFYTGEDPICDHIMENLGLGDAELPLIAIIDILSGTLALCDNPDVSEEIISEFVSDYKSDKIPLIQLPSSKTEKTQKVGGIPMKIIEQALDKTMVNEES
uniref:Thioredoxin-like_fold domain-containing protein n=1 Tax=Parastrongyloides trichosuri TaxID=131310 RepID=A0A0N4Z222_PARTI